jgi:hypothetical protein
LEVAVVKVQSGSGVISVFVIGEKCVLVSIFVGGVVLLVCDVLDVICMCKLNKMWRVMDVIKDCVRELLDCMADFLTRPPPRIFE